MERLFLMKDRDMLSFLVCGVILMTCYHFFFTRFPT